MYQTIRHRPTVRYLYCKLIYKIGRRHRQTRCYWFQSNLNYKYICQQKLDSIYCNLIICFILTPLLTPTSQPLLPFPLKLQNFTSPNESLMSVCYVCVCRFGISFTYMIESIDLKLISVCLINDYSLIAQLHIFFYERAEFSSISLECINNFDWFDLKNFN